MLFRANTARTIVFFVAAFLGFATRSGPQAETANPNADAGWSAFTASMETMHHAMAAVHQSKDTDLNFVNLMLPHHQAAIEMAKAQLRYGADPQMRRLAQEVITDQQSEIELMRLWLKNHRSPVSIPVTK
jgi:uncharacterized protein (DUF305 family)